MTTLASPSATWDAMSDEQRAQWLDINQIFVAAAYRRNFINWCEEHGISTLHPNVKHVFRREHFAGIRSVPMFLAYGWWESEELDEALREYCAINSVRFPHLPHKISEFLALSA